jgi:hypothetical protein
MHQVDNFAVTAPDEHAANILYNMIDDLLTFPMKRMGLINLFNGLDIEQTRDYVEISCSTYIGKIMAKHLSNWLSTHDILNQPTPLLTKKSFLSSFLNAIGNSNPKTQQQLAKTNTFGYCNGVGELIYALTTCPPDLAYATVRAAQYSGCPAAIHYQGLRHKLKYLYTTKDNWIIFWYVTPNETLPKKPPCDINSHAHDLLLDSHPIHDPTDLHAFVDVDWAACPQTCHSFTGCCLHLAGGTVAYKTKLQPTVAQSSTETEFMGACDSGKMLLYVCSIMWDLRIPQTAALMLYKDNDACIAMANTQKPTAQTCHMDIKYHVICEWVNRDLICHECSDTTVHTSDHFTKQLSPTLFHHHVDYIMGRVPPQYSPWYHRLFGETHQSLVLSQISIPPGLHPIFAAAARLIAY